MPNYKSDVRHHLWYASCIIQHISDSTITKFWSDCTIGNCSVTGSPYMAEWLYGTSLKHHNSICMKINMRPSIKKDLAGYKAMFLDSSPISSVGTFSAPHRNFYIKKHMIALDLWSSNYTLYLGLEASIFIRHEDWLLLMFLWLRCFSTSTFRFKLSFMQRTLPKVTKCGYSRFSLQILKNTDLRNTFPNEYDLNSF